MEEVVARGISKDGLLTDEPDLAEVVAHSKSTSKSVVHGVGGKRGGERQPPSEYYEMAEKFNTQSWPGRPKLIRPYNFEIEPGHFDYMAILSSPHSKRTVSDPGSRNHISGALGSLLVSKREPGSVNYSNSREELSRSGSGTSKASQGRASAHRQITRAETPAEQIVKQSVLTNYTWDEVQAMMHRATLASPGGKNEVGGSWVADGAPSSRHVVLGTGGFGDVCLGMLAAGDKKLVAVKVLATHSRQGDLEFLNEVNLLSSAHHVNLVKLLGFCQQGSHRVLVYEYAEEGSIHDHLHGKRMFLDWRTRLKIGLESACGLEYLHTGCNRRIIHRDIKSNNILLSKTLVAKVADFGLCKMGLEDNSSAQGPVSTAVKGTPGYVDPVYLTTGKLDEMSDIYSFGVVLLELITGRRPTSPNADQVHIGDWVKKKSGAVKEIVDSELRGNYNSKAMKEVCSLALKCIDQVPENRPDIRKVLSRLREAVEMENNPLRTSPWTLKSLWGPS